MRTYVKKLGNFDENIKYNAIDIFYDIKIKNIKNEHRKERVIDLNPVFWIIPRTYSELSHRYSELSQEVFRIIPRSIPSYPNRYFELSQ